MMRRAGCWSRPSEAFERRRIADYKTTENKSRLKHIRAALDQQSGENPKHEELLWNAYEKDVQEMRFTFYHTVRAQVCSIIGCNTAWELCDTEDEKAIFQQGMRVVAKSLLEFLDKRISEFESQNPAGSLVGIVKKRKTMHTQKDFRVALRVLKKALASNLDYIAYLSQTELSRQLPEIYLAEQRRTEIENTALEKIIVYLEQSTAS